MNNNEFIKNLQKSNHITSTENGAAAYNTTFDAVYDLFSLGGAYRQRDDEECRTLFWNAYHQNPILAIKALFWLGDCRGGAGERRFFKVCFRDFCIKRRSEAKKVLSAVPEYTRWDVLIKAAYDTPVWTAAMEVVDMQLAKDIATSHPSLLAKWLPSENASSKETKELAKAVRTALHLSAKGYRKILSRTREKVKVTEKLMSANRWNEIAFDKLPSKAGLNYAYCFKTREETAQRYAEFINSKETKVNAGTLFPYDIVHKVTKNIKHDFSYLTHQWDFTYEGDSIERETFNKFWANQKDYLEGNPCKMICVCDTSGSMQGDMSAAPINVAISLSMYCAERLGGDFHNKFITFSSEPKFIDLDTMGSDFVSRVTNIYATNLCEDTNIEATFNLLLEACKNSKPEDRPETVVVLSDMQINGMVTDREMFNEKNCSSSMEKLRKKWDAAGIKMPKLIYWNVNARKDTILESGDNVSFVSGASPSLFTAILTGKSGYNLMMEALNNERYDIIEQLLA